MSETESKKFGKQRQKLVEKIRQKGNQNLAEAIKTTPAKTISKKETISAWKKAFPEFKNELIALQTEAQSFMESEKKFYEPESYFERDNNGNLKFKPDILAQEIQEEYQFKFVEDTELFYVYKDDYWQNRAERIIKQECNTRLGREYEPHYASKTVDTIKNRESVAVENKKNFQPSKNKIPFKNCVYDVEKQEIENHKPEHHFTHKIQYDYDPDAQCPEINQFLSEVVETEKDKELILETIGYSLLADMPYEHSLILYGGGKNGKSVLLNVWKELLGATNFKEEELQQLENGRFATRWLYRKLALFSDDLPATKLETGNTLKSLTGGGETRAEIKGGDHFEFENFATPVFACNEIPVSNDDTDGFYRRWEIVNFPFKFVEDPVKPNHKKQKPKDKLVEKLTCTSEMEGLINEAVARLELAKQNGGIYHKTDADSTRALWKSYSSPLEQFVENCLDQGLTQKDAAELDDSVGGDTSLSEYNYDFVIKDDLVWLIGKYCEFYDKRPPTKTRITQYLKNESTYYVQEGRTRQLGSDNRRNRVYKFLKFSDEFLDFVDGKKKCPDCPYFFAHLRAHARKIERSLEKSRDTKDTSEFSVGEMIESFISKQSENEIPEQFIIEEIDSDTERVEEKLDEMIQEGDLFRPRPGVVSKL